jgi:beta-lactamase class A
MAEFGDSPHDRNGRTQSTSQSSHGARSSQIRRSSQMSRGVTQNSGLPAASPSDRSSSQNSQLRAKRGRSQSWLNFFIPTSNTANSSSSQLRGTHRSTSEKARQQSAGVSGEPVDRHRSATSEDRRQLANDFNSRLRNSSLNSSSSQIGRSSKMPVASSSQLKPDARSTRKQELQARRTRRLRNSSSPTRSNSALGQKAGREKTLEPRSMTLAGARVPSRKRSLSSLAFLYGVRLVILGIGVGAIAGTLLSIWDPASRFTAGASPVEAEQKTPAAKSNSTIAASTAFRMGQEMSAVKTQIQTWAAQTPQLMPGIFVVDSDSGAYLDINGSLTFPAASTIKIPILVAFFQDVDEGKIRLDELLTLKPEEIGSGSGELQFRNPGSQYTALEVATKMITISDNTATNMIINRLGGAAALNQRFQSWGMSATLINNPLPDLTGTNTTSPKDLTMLMAQLSQGELVSLRSRDRLLDIMSRTVNNSLLPTGIDAEATISHKTGTIDSLLGDAGLVDTPNGKRYVITVLVKHANTDAPAQDLIQQVSRLVYKTITQPTAQANPSPDSQTAPVDPEEMNAGDASYPSTTPQPAPPSPTTPQSQIAQP